MRAETLRPGVRQPFSDKQTSALISAGLSSAGAAFAGVGCWTSTTTCGLGADAARQFSIAATAQDPLVELAQRLGAGPSTAQSAALALQRTALSSRPEFYSRLAGNAWA